jgi:integrase
VAQLQGVDDTLDITRCHFEDYRKQRSKNVKSVTVKTHMDTIRVFIRNLEDYQAVPDNLSEHVRSPDLQDGEGQRSDHLPVDRGDTILENVRKYLWGSLEHVVYELWWASGIRLGGVHSIDEDDVYLDERYIEVRHRPDEGTTLKNQSDGERDVSITPATADAIEDYPDNPERPDVTEENGRNPLLASPHNGGGRYSKSHLRNICYHLTLPCVTEGGECPHDKEPQECDYRANKNKASQCPSSKAPHALRSGALTRQLKRGVNPLHQRACERGCRHVGGALQRTQQEGEDGGAAEI